MHHASCVQVYYCTGTGGYPVCCTTHVPQYERLWRRALLSSVSSISRFYFYRAFLFPLGFFYSIKYLNLNILSQHSDKFNIFFCVYSTLYTVSVSVWSSVWSNYHTVPEQNSHACCVPRTSITQPPISTTFFQRFDVALMSARVTMCFGLSARKKCTVT